MIFLSLLRFSSTSRTLPSAFLHFYPMLKSLSSPIAACHTLPFFTKTDSIITPSLFTEFICCLLVFWTAYGCAMDLLKEGFRVKLLSHTRTDTHKLYLGIVGPNTCVFVCLLPCLWVMQQGNQTKTLFCKLHGMNSCRSDTFPKTAAAIFLQ